MSHDGSTPSAWCTHERTRAHTQTQTCRTAIARCDAARATRSGASDGELEGLLRTHTLGFAVDVVDDALAAASCLADDAGESAGDRG
jgi:hypothetical protein